MAGPQDTFATARALADLYGRYIDQPQASTYSNPTYSQDPGFEDFARQLDMLVPNASQQNPQQFGETQNPPQYRGIRMLLPESGGEYDVLKQGRVQGFNPLYQALLGTMITRGYPLLGGTGQFPGREQGFNPIGFGQR